MKTWITVIGICFIFLVGCNKSDIEPNPTSTLEETITNETEAQMLIPDLEAVPEGSGWNGSIQTASLVEKDGAPAIEFNKLDWNLVWLDGLEFNDGTIEFDAKGKSEPPQGSFVGIWCYGYGVIANLQVTPGS